MKLILTAWLAVAISSAVAAPTERGIYDGAGKLTALVCADAKLAVKTQFTVGFAGDIEAAMQPDGQPTHLTRAGWERRWSGDIPFLNGGDAAMLAAWKEDDAGVALHAVLTAGARLDVTSVDGVIDVPRTEFQGGRLEPAGTPLPVTKPDEVAFFHGSVDALTFTDAGGTRTLSLKWDQPHPVTVTDRWDAAGRSYRVRIQLRAGTWNQGEALKLDLALQATGAAAVPPPAHLSVDPAAVRSLFDGYGGNYCWDGTPAMTTFMLDGLQHAWTRHELKAEDWDREHAAPGGGLVQDFELMQRVQRRGIPWILSVWNLPQRFYRDANQRPRGSFGRTIAPERWDDLLDLFGSYLLYLKEHYGAEPDLFSFNEPDLGVDVGFTPKTYRDAIRRIGARLASLGLKTKILLGDTANPRDTHAFVLAAAADPEAMRHVGAVSFHSWGNASPAQYEAWADLAGWLRLPLLVAEAGVDPAAYHNHTYDSYDYGLSEAAQQQDLLRYARPAATLFWQYTSDYGLLHLRPDGAVEPTARFWLMKHFTDLTPRRSQVLASTSDRPDVLISAFRRDDTLAVHLLNLGPGRRVVISGLPAGSWRMVTTRETVAFEESGIDVDSTGTVTLPARSLVTLEHCTPPGPTRLYGPGL